MPKLNYEQIINNLQDQYLKEEIPDVQIGDNVKIGVKIIEGNERFISNPKYN